MIQAVLFDLDGTLLPMDIGAFSCLYFEQLVKAMGPLGYSPETLKEGVLGGIMAQLNNDGSRTNEEVFWSAFSRIHGEDARKDQERLNEFYRGEFSRVKSSCGFDPRSKEIVYWLRSRGTRVILATNPVFPAPATQARIRWAGLEPEDFELYTTYENSRYCKPDLSYYRDILEQTGLLPEQCLMVGNDVREDMVARKLGMEVFLLTPCLINRDNEDIEQFPHGEMDDLKRFIFDLG